jgi:hypothetical protein
LNADDTVVSDMKAFKRLLEENVDKCLVLAKELEQKKE